MPGVNYVGRRAYLIVAVHHDHRLLPLCTHAGGIRVRCPALDRSGQDPRSGHLPARWVANGDNVVLLGTPGVGKTHLEVALGREAVSRGYTVQFTTAMELLGSLVKGQQQGTLEVRLAQYSKSKQLISSNRPVEEWDGVNPILWTVIRASRW